MANHAYATQGQPTSYCKKKDFFVVLVLLSVVASQFTSFLYPRYLLLGQQQQQTSLNHGEEETNNSTLVLVRRVDRLEMDLQETNARLDGVLSLLEESKEGRRVDVSEEDNTSGSAAKDNVVAWNPQRFSTPSNLPNNLQRGMHFLTTLSGCRMASWSYVGGSEEDTKSIAGWLIELYKDCQYQSTAKQKLTHQSDPALVQKHDTIYVTFSQIPHFVQYFLPKIANQFVLITGQTQKESFPIAWENGTKVIPNEYRAPILENPHVLHWFCQNLEVYLPNATMHPNRIHSFPYGLKGEGGIKDYSVPTYRKVFLDSLQNATQQNATKTKKVHNGYIGRQHNAPSRWRIPSAPKVEMEPYLRAIADSHYVLSPNGDRPECYRHYEVIGLGATPITELDPAYYAHFGNAIVYRNTDWNLDRLRETLPSPPAVPANRNMVFEEYWMEYVERVANVGPLRWFDRVREEQSLLSEFAVVDTTTNFGAVAAPS